VLAFIVGIRWLFYQYGPDRSEQAIVFLESG
jgi:hypothetical protein